MVRTVRTLIGVGLVAAGCGRSNGTPGDGDAGVTTRSSGSARPAVTAQAPRRIVDEWAQAASDWRTLPVVARIDEARATSTWDAKSKTRHWRAPLGDIFVSFDQIVTCDWGGSACIGSEPDCAALRVGDLDAEDRPALAVEAKLATRGGKCFLDKLALRKTSDGRVWMVSARDDSGDERLAAVFTRSQ